MSLKGLIVYLKGENKMTEPFMTVKLVTNFSDSDLITRLDVDSVVLLTLITGLTSLCGEDLSDIPRIRELKFMASHLLGTMGEAMDKILDEKSKNR